MNRFSKRFAKALVIIARCGTLMLTGAAVIGLAACNPLTGPGDGGGTPDDPGTKPADALLQDSILVDFDAETPGIAGAGFAGDGLVLEPGIGQLDSDAWEIFGFSDGDAPFGSVRTDGDLARGTSLGGESTGGLYAFSVSPDNTALGVQATASDFAPGSITARMPLADAINDSTIEELNLEMSVWQYNDQDRSTGWQVDVSTDNLTWLGLVDLSGATGVAADPEPEWIMATQSTPIPLEELVPPIDGVLYVRWSCQDQDGSGGRDEIAIDDIRLTYGWR